MLLHNSLTPIKCFTLIYHQTHSLLAIIQAHSDFLQQIPHNSKQMPFHNSIINVIAPEDLIIAKLALGRFQDYARIHALLCGGLPVDKSYITHHIHNLNFTIPNEIEQLLSIK